MDSTQAGAQFAANSQTTIDLQAGIIASHQDEIGRANVRITDQAAEIERLKIVVADRNAKVAELMGAVARAGIAAPAAPSEQAEPGAPHILEALSYHGRERDDLTLEEAVKVIRFGWQTVCGRTDRAMVLQIADLLASAAAPAAPIEQTYSAEDLFLRAKVADLIHVSEFALSMSEIMSDADKKIAADSIVSIKRILAREPAPAAPLPAQPEQSDELHFNAQRLRNVAKLVGLESAVPQSDATLDGARGAVLGQIAAKLREQSAANIAAMVNRFLGWPLPKTFAPDCGISFKELGHPNSWPVGTNLLTAVGAKAMFEYVLAGAAPLPELTGPSEATALSKRLREIVGDSGVPRKFNASMISKVLLSNAADEIERLQTAKSHLILQAQIWHMEAKVQHATLIGILRRMGLPENDWEAERLIFAHIDSLAASPSPAPAPSEPISRHTIAEMLAIYDKNDGDWLNIARSVEDRFVIASEATSPASSMGGITSKACDFCEGAGGWGSGEDAEGCTKCNGTGKASAETAAPGASTEDKQ